ncbi:transcription elongation factor TFIIS [Cryptosporidium ubiquitum]|uniref:Transcription elongation factor TFIIS n=1 Tax=Cryptosporidium ubiquitum TaxID=857276 RepID=A0A1J4MN30_9CRYT|nr:transcription elongation factor TFIIS [Cryptosporidium ubiquitum]OII75576.1 transcription elongation factor TFIIS [Cryptosporidium ubiquitum]
MEGSMQIELRNALEQGLVENEAFKNVDIHSLSKSIEEDFLKVMSGKDNRIIRQRRFELMSNLKRPNNSDLRRRILAGEMSVREFVTCPVSELAPDSVKQQRLEEQKRYFKEECILMMNDRDSIEINEKKRNSSFDDINDEMTEYNIETSKDLSEESGNDTLMTKKSKRFKSDKRVLEIFPDLPISLSVPPDLSHITPRYNLNKYIDKYKEMIKDVNIQSELIKQAKLRIVTTT